LKNVLYKKKVLSDTLNSNISMILNDVATVSRLSKVILNFSNGIPYFLFYIFVADVETFSKHWLQSFYHENFTNEWDSKFTVLLVLALNEMKKNLIAR